MARHASSIDKRCGRVTADRYPSELLALVANEFGGGIDTALLLDAMELRKGIPGGGLLPAGGSPGGLAGGGALFLFDAAVHFTVLCDTFRQALGRRHVDIGFAHLIL
jgi:hypothetical protein